MKITFHTTIKKSIFIVSLTILFTNLHAQELKSNYSINDCLSFAKENNQDIKKAVLEETQSKSKIKEVIGSGLPQITISGNLVDNIELPTTLFPEEYFGGTPGSFMEAKMGTQYQYIFTAEASQMIFNGSFWVGLDAAKYSNQYYNQNVRNVQETALYNVAASYFQTLSIYEQLGLLQQNYLLVEQSLADTKLKYDNGKAQEVEVNRLQVNLNIIKYQIERVKDSYNQSISNLKYLMGMDVNTEIKLVDNNILSDTTILQQLFEVNNNQKQSISYENRIEYQILQTTLELQKLNKKNVLAQYIPSISAYGSFSYQGLRTEFDLFDSDKKWFNFYSVGLRLLFPIFQGGQTIAKLDQASIEIDKVNQDIKKAENGINMQINISSNKFNTAAYNSNINKQNMELAKKVYDITLLEYKEGVTNSLYLTDSETKLREAQTNYVNSLLDLQIAKLDLEKAKGTLFSYLNTFSNK